MFSNNFLSGKLFCRGIIFNSGSSLRVRSQRHSPAYTTNLLFHKNSLESCIHVLYVYDALVCEEKDSELVAETMNRIILEHGVKTTAKLSITKEEAVLEAKQERIVIDASNMTHSLRVKAMLLERMKNGDELIFVDAVIEFGKNDTMLDKVLKIYDKQNPEACYVSESFIMSA